jgi:hypothetical protein
MMALAEARVPTDAWLGSTTAVVCFHLAKVPASWSVHTVWFARCSLHQ